uniref:Zinc finger, CCHC-type n=1 Tax=Tanacetum cinerariifolium TaxID=118510 RepID=A0A6L2P3J6_TANCI|nr:zinc finger, CCHC-type [Tanacetum cinerariifolium]
MIEPNLTTEADTKKDKTDIAYIYQSLPEQQLLLISKYKTAKEVWDALKKRHVRENRVQQDKKQTLKSEFEMLQMKENESVDSFTTKLTNIVNKAASVGLTYEDFVVIKKLLNSVPAKFLQIVASIEQYSDLDEISVDEAIERLKTFQERLKSKKEIPVDSQESLMFTRHEGQGKPFRERGQGEDLTSLEAENKTRTIINLRGKNEHLLKKIQEINIKSHVTNVTNMDTMPMNVQTNARIKSENKITENAEITESAEITGSVETTVSVETAVSTETTRSAEDSRECRKFQNSINVTTLPNSVVDSTSLTIATPENGGSRPHKLTSTLFEYFDMFEVDLLWILVQDVPDDDNKNSFGTTNVSYVGLSALAKCHGSLDFSIVQNLHCTYAGLIRVVERCTGVRTLCINDKIRDHIRNEGEGLLVVGRHCVNLQDVLLIGVKATSTSLQVIATNGLKLVGIELCRSETISDVELSCIGDKCLSLKILCIEDPDEGIEVLGLACLNLMNIRVTKVRKVTLKVGDLLRAKRASRWSKWILRRPQFL